MTTDFGGHLRGLLRSCGVSQSELARRVDLDHTHISRLVTGQRGPSFEAVQSIADALGLNATEEARLFWASGYKRRQEQPVRLMAPDAALGEGRDHDAA